MADLQVANTILSQLGGKRFQAMTGASRFTGSENALSFFLPSTPHYAKDGINHVRITLTPMDTYTVTFGRVWGRSYKLVDEIEEVYCDTLQAVFTAHTGLATHL